MPGSQTVSVAEAVYPGRAGTGARPGWLELGLLLIVLLLFSEGVLPRLIASEQADEGSPLLRLLWLPVYALVLAGLVWKFRAVASALMRMPFMAALIVLSALSFLWSIDPGLSQRRGIAVVFTTLAGILIGTRYDWQTLLRVLGLSWVLVATLSCLTGLLNPGFGVMSEIHVGAWTGLYYEKNQLGGHMARAAFLCGFLLVMDRRWRKVWAFGALISALMVVLSTSMTALLGLILGFAILALGAWMRRGIVTGLMTVWLCVVIGGGLALAMLLVPELIFAALGRDPTLTGRTDIWAALVGKIGERPVLGYGYGAFWAVDSEPAYWVREVLEWDAPTAHNGWLEVAIGLGLVGLACLVLDFLMTIGRALRLALTSWLGIFALGVCAQFLLFSLSESISLQQNALTWLTYVAVAAKLAARPQVRGHQPGRSLRQGATQP